MTSPRLFGHVATGPAIPRRGFIALGGAGLAGAALAGCGADVEQRSAGEDGDLLGAAVAAEAALAEAYRFAEQASSARDAAVLRAFGARADAHADELTTLLEQEGGSPPAHEGAGGGEESPLEGAIAALREAIAAHREAAALLSSTELRATAFRFAAEDAAQLAAVLALIDEEPSPHAFVTGESEPPLEFPETTVAEE